MVKVAEDFHKQLFNRIAMEIISTQVISQGPVPSVKSTGLTKGPDSNYNHNFLHDQTALRRKTKQTHVLSLIPKLAISTQKLWKGHGRAV